MDNVKLVEQDSRPTKKQIKKYSGFANESVSSRKKTEWYVLLRNVQGADGLKEIESGTLEHLIDNFEFLKNSLFCEYAYILNLDDMTLEFYKGFNKNSNKQENYSLPIEFEVGKCEYYPVSFCGSVDIKEIPKTWFKKMYPEDYKESQEYKKVQKSKLNRIIDGEHNG